MDLLISLTIFVFGTSIGSFLNVLIDRLPKDESINGRSRCDYCRRKIPWYDLIPVLSFFVLRAKTRCCHKKLSFQYPLVEIMTGIIFTSIFSFYPPVGGSVFNQFSIIKLLIILGVVSCLIVIFVSDFRYHLISDYILWALFVFSLLYKVWTPSFDGVTNWVIPARAGIQSVISALIIGFPIFLIYYISHERAMGLGDVYLSVIIGFMLGWSAGGIALYIAFVTGAIYGIILMILYRKKFKNRIAFGPFLVIGTIIMLFYSKEVFGMIQRIYGF